MSLMHQVRAVGDVHLLEDSLVAAKMSVLRDKTTATVQFRRALEQIAILLLSEASKHFSTLTSEIETPLAPMAGGEAGVAGSIRANFAGGSWITRRNVTRPARGADRSHR